MIRKRVFLASSNELKEDRISFEIFINRKNKEWITKGVFLELIIWEDFLDVVSKTRLQDEYNKAILESDIFIMLFSTKVGKYTEEEFETAFGQFKTTNRPYIFTYFKDAHISVTNAREEDLISLWAFQRKLRGLGHFQTVYKSVEDLNFQFGQQLDKLGSDLGLDGLAVRGAADLGVARVFQTKTRDFMNEYLISETGRVPFGGRDGELRQLDEWLLDPNGVPRMLVTAPAGRGKSALLVRWVKGLQDKGACGPDGWELAVVPISIRFKTNRPEIFYCGLASRLAEITHVPLPGEAFQASDGFRDAVRDQLDRLSMEGRPRVLVIIDGVDEALGDSFDVDILPRVMPANLRVLLSARWQVGDYNSDGWLERLGWDRGVKVETLSVDPLKTDQIEDVLINLGAPADVLRKEPGLIARLGELTEGEPLLVRYYAEDLWTASSKGARVTQADLDSLSPGFDSYFKRWFQHQEQLWRYERTTVDTQQIDAVLSILAFALGPLSATDLSELVEQIHKVSVIAVDRLLDPLRRWVFGRGESDAGYVLSHPKIGDYLQRGRFAASAGKLKNEFAHWGKAHCLALNEGRIAPEQAKPYCLQFLPAHLKQAKASPENFMLMVENGWRLGWEKLEGAQRGFSDAVQMAFEAQREVKGNFRLAARWRCALTLSSIKSLGVNVPAKLLLVAVDKGVLTVRQAAHFADFKGPSAESIELLAGLAIWARENVGLREELLVSALADIQATSDEHYRSHALVALASQLAPEQVGEALAAARALGNAGDQVSALAALSPRLALEQRSKVLSEALALASTIDDDRRVQALAALAPHLGPEQVGEALAAAKAIGDNDDRVLALAILAPRLQPDQLREALASAEALTDGGHRATALAALAPHLRPEHMGEALAAIEMIGEAGHRATALAALAPHLAPEQVSSAVATARAIREASPRARALAALARHLTPKQVGEALAAAKAIGEGDDRARTLAALVPYLTSEQLDEALAIAKTFDNEGHLATALAALAPRLAPDQASRALAAATAIGDDDSRAQALAALAPHLAPNKLGEALAAAAAIGDNFYRSQALGALAPHLATEQRHQALDNALAAARVIGDKRSRSQALVALAPQLAPEQVGAALAAAQAIGDEVDRSGALVVLASYLAPEQRNEILDEALAAAKAIGDDYPRLHALAALAPQLMPRQLGEALAAAKTIGDESPRARALAALAPHLVPEQVGEALAAARAIGEASPRARALVALAPRLTSEQVGEVLAAVEALRDDYPRSQALAALAPHLTPKQVSTALAAAKSIRDKDDSVRALAALASRLGPEQVGEVVAAVKVLRDDYPRSQALAALAPYLTPEQAAEALTVARTIGDEHFRVRTLVALAPRLRPEQVGEALAAAKEFYDTEHRATVLTALAPHLAPEHVGEALAAAKAIGKASSREWVLIALAPHLAAEQVGEALTTARMIEDYGNRVTALAALAPYLTPEQMGEALAAANAIGDENYSTRALVALAPHLTPKQVGEALIRTNAISDERFRSRALAALEPHLTPDLRDETSAKFIEAVSSISRRSALVSVRNLAGTTFDSGGHSAIIAMFHAIKDVSCWYP